MQQHADLEYQVPWSRHFGSLPLTNGGSIVDRRKSFEILSTQSLGFNIISQGRVAFGIRV